MIRRVKAVYIPQCQEGVGFHVQLVSWPGACTLSLYLSLAHLDPSHCHPQTGSYETSLKEKNKKF